MSVFGTAKGYFRSGVMTEDKKVWMKRQIEGLRKANDELWRQAERVQVQKACNERQIDQLERILKGYES